MDEIVLNNDKEALRRYVQKACDELADILTDELAPMMFNTPSGEKHFGFKIFKSETDKRNSEIIIKFEHEF